MSIRVLLPQTVYGCSMCPASEWSDWRALAGAGWTCNHVHGHEPILLCPECAAIIATRRAAA